MSIFDFLRKKKHNSKKELSISYRDENIEKTTIETYYPKEQRKHRYRTGEVEIAFDGYKKTGQDNFIRFNIRNVSIPQDVYYGYTKYTGEVNKNGKQEVAFTNTRGETIACLDRKQWNDYEKMIGKDKKRWIGHSSGDYFRVVVFMNKVKEETISSILEMYDYQESMDNFSTLLSNKIEELQLLDGKLLYKKSISPYGDFMSYYNMKYKLAGVHRYVNSPFVAFGVATNENSNEINPKAIIIHTLEGIKVGYIGEDELDNFYSENEGDRIPLVIEAHYYAGKLFGNVYTFTNNIKEKEYLQSQYTILVRART